ncbi:MAG: membrane protein insertase YidC [Bacteroidota bacterium]
MDRSTIVGLVLILAIFTVWQVMVAPSAEELAAQQRYQDSIAALNEAELLPEVDIAEPEFSTSELASLTDSVREARFGQAFGAFAAAAAGQAEDVVLENDLLKLTFSTKGGFIKRAELKEFNKMLDDDAGTVEKLPLLLLEDPKNNFDYTIPVNGVSGAGIHTSDLYFQHTIEGNTLIMRAPASGGGYLEQRYTITDGTYLIDYDLRLEGLNNVIGSNGGAIDLQWDNYLDKIEKNAQYEANQSTMYFKPIDDGSSYCTCTSSDTEEVEDQKVKWVAGSQQFFTSDLISDDGFAPGALLATEVFDEANPNLKKVSASLKVPIGRSGSEIVGMQLYIGPNDFERMRAIGHDLSDVISFGRSIFGGINRWVIRPMFNFLLGFIGSKGIAILVLTLIVKLLVYPLTYKMLVSNMKMQVLKPELEKMKAKYKDDAQAQQMQQMKMYQEYGASPLGGCLPMVLQMPIWFALYRFFPASIEFRQESFLWANDLSSYDVLTKIPEWIPFMQGHLSLFAVLWAITTVIYAYYNSRHMDYSAQPMMKYFQYVMPILFLGFFNSFASGLTAYLLFSNTFNIIQTIVTKNFLIDEEKLLAKMNENKKKPKKKNGFGARLQEALAEQQRQQAKQQGKKK